MSPEPRPFVSVVIATHNCEQYLGLAIESVLAQTHEHLELHVVNDGSTDGTADVVRQYSHDGRLHYHEQKNAGQTSAKNRGIRASSGQFIAFCDADDVWMPDKLALQLPWFERDNSIGVVYSRAGLIAEDGRPLESESGPVRCRSGRITEDLFKFNFIPFGTAVIRRGCLEDMGPFDERLTMGIDWELWLRLSTRYEFMFVDAVTYQYRIWPGQMSRNWRGRYDATFAIMEKFLSQHPGLIRPEVVREAWASCFVQRARLRARQSHEYMHALADLGRALHWRPASLHAWKSVAYVISAAAGADRA